MLFVTLLPMNASAQTTAPAKPPPGNSPPPKVVQAATPDETPDGSCGFPPEQREAQLKSGESRNDLLFIFVGGANDGSHSILGGPLGADHPFKNVYTAVCGEDKNALKVLHKDWLIAYFEFNQDKDIIRFMKAHPFRVILIGHSYGADTAAYITAACNKSRVQPLINDARAKAQTLEKTAAAKAKTAIQSVFGHVLATSCTDQTVSGLITVDPVSQLAGKEYTPYLKLYYSAVRSSTPFWIDINATPTNPNSSDTVARLGNKWGNTVGTIPDYGESNRNHAQFAEMIQDTNIHFSTTSVLSRTCNSPSVVQFLASKVNLAETGTCKPAPTADQGPDLSGTWIAQVSLNVRSADPFGLSPRFAPRAARLSEGRAAATFSRTQTGYKVTVSFKVFELTTNNIASITATFDLASGSRTFPTYIEPYPTKAVVWLVGRPTVSGATGGLSKYFDCSLFQGLQLGPLPSPFFPRSPDDTSPPPPTIRFTPTLQTQAFLQACDAWAEFSFKR